MDAPVRPVVTRMAPSPTGYLHIGSARTGLFNYLFAKHAGGRFLLRIEDTDKERSKPEFEAPIVEGFEWLGIVPDAFYRQSEHLERHRACLIDLIARNRAYLSREPKKDDPTVEVEVVRLRNPGSVITFEDHVRGSVSFDTTELGDFVIARSIDDPLYHLAVVVDDFDEGVTHVIRAEEHLSNTPRQILIQDALGFPRPEYAHLPLMLAPDRSKLSKRKGVVAVTAYRDEGFYPEAMLNYLALQGWNPGTPQELFTMDELIAAFSFQGVQKGGAVFDRDKLLWMNREYRKQRAPDLVMHEYLQVLDSQPQLRRVLEAHPRAFTDAVERFSTVREFEAAAAQGEWRFFEERPVLVREMLLYKKDPDPTHAAAHLAHVRTRLSELAASGFGYDAVKAAVMPHAEAVGRGAVLWPLRYALSGREHSPDPFLLAEALGKEETVARIKEAEKLLT